MWNTAGEELKEPGLADLTNSQGEVWLSLEWCKDFPHAVVSMVLPIIWEGMDTQGYPDKPPVLISVFSIPLWESYDFKSIFL